MKELIRTAEVRATIFGQYFFAFVTLLFCIPTEIFFRLEAASAVVAHWLARRRYSIKEEGPAYFTMTCQEIAQSVINIKDPVQASHERFEESTAPVADTEEEFVSAGVGLNGVERPYPSGPGSDDTQTGPEERSLNS